jgi:hypothetical protein
VNPNPRNSDSFTVTVFVMRQSDFVSRTLNYHVTINWQEGASVFRKFEDDFRERAGDNTLSLWRFGYTEEDETLDCPIQKLPPLSKDITTLVGMRAPPVQRIGSKNFGGDSDPDLQSESTELEVYVNWCRRKYPNEDTVFLWAYHSRFRGKLAQVLLEAQAYGKDKKSVEKWKMTF